MDSDPDYSVDEEEIEDEQSSSEAEAEAGDAQPLPGLYLGGETDRLINRRVESESEESPGDEKYNESPLKRPAEDAILAPRPFKRQKGVFNNDYLDLLNRDIEDAAQRVCLEDEPDLPPTQLGLTLWSSLEKKIFFEAVARLGRYDLSGIASRVGSKSVVEVNHYVNALQEARSLRRKTDNRSILGLHDFPAAIELSQQCCHAQDEAADAVSVRQERREQQREENKWDYNWDITPRVAQELDGKDAATSQRPAFAQIFHLQRWLQLSQRVFMNSSIPGDNWNFIDNSPPSVWATTFEDFHSLAISITRRLVQTTLFISMSRIRAKKELQSGTRAIVRKNDAEAAIASLGLTANTRDFWLKSARRLRLSVYKDLPDHYEDDDEDPMTYDDVEHALSEERNVDSTPDPFSTRFRMVSPSEDDSLQSIGPESEALISSDEEEADDINQEANEVLKYSAADFPETYRTKQALRSRIAMEKQQEQYAERCDDHASSLAEAEMWDLLQRLPPMELPRRQDPGAPARSNKDVESIYLIGREWRDRLEYYSEWETRADSGAERERSA